MYKLEVMKKKELRHFKFWATIIILSLFILMLSACSGKEDTTDMNNPAQSTLPQQEVAASPSDAAQLAPEYTGGTVELLFGDLGAQVTEKDVIELIQPLIHAKHPQINLKWVAMGHTAEVIQQRMVLHVPDIIITAAGYFHFLQALDFPEELDAMAKQFNIDMNRMDPVVVGDLRKMSGKDKTALYGLPFDQQLGGTMYNKNLFDKFGLDYPHENITWDEAIDIAHRMTRTEEGVSYYGMITTSLVNLLKEAGVSNYDSKDESVAILSSDGHNKVFSMLTKLYGHPGYKNGLTNSYTDISFDIYGKNGIVSMFPNFISKTVMNTPMEFDWDLTNYPIYQDTPHIGKNLDFRVSVVSKSSKHKEAAYHVLNTLISDEVQLAMNKDGRFTILDDNKIKETYAENSGFFIGKNLAAAYSLSPAPVPDYSPHADQVNAAINAAANAIIIKNVDLNTALREAEEAANRAIKDKLGQ